MKFLSFTRFMGIDPARVKGVGRVAEFLYACFHAPHYMKLPCVFFISDLKAVGSKPAIIGNQCSVMAAVELRDVGRL